MIEVFSLVVLVITIFIALTVLVAGVLTLLGTIKGVDLDDWDDDGKK